MKNSCRVLFAGAAILFVCGVGSAQAPGFRPVGTVRQIMLGIVAPSSDVIFAVPNKLPTDDAGWQRVQNSSLTLAEAANLLMIPGRAKDKNDWMKFASQLNAVGAEAFKAANMKNAAALDDIGNKIDALCEGCHAKYLPKQQ
jgi:hypothetical protein